MYIQQNAARLHSFGHTLRDGIEKGYIFYVLYMANLTTVSVMQVLAHGRSASSWGRTGRRRARVNLRRGQGGTRRERAAGRPCPVECHLIRGGAKVA